MKKALLILHQKRSTPGDVALKLISRGYSLDIRKPCLGDKLPLNMDDHDLAIIFGGPMSTNDECLEFIKYEIEWIKVPLESNKPFLGICLGAQMLAKHLGGSVSSCEDNFSEIGFFDIFPTNSGNEIFKNHTKFFQWHSEGFTLPNNCEILAKGDKFKTQAFKYKNAYGIQFHPEVNFYVHLRWLYFVFLYSRYRLKAKGAQSVIKQLSLRFKYNRDMSNWLEYFLDNYLLKV